MKYSKVIKAGRCFNGAHRDSGTVVHAVTDSEPNGPWFTKSICGTSPGRRGYGWKPTDNEVNCEKCKYKIEFSKTIF